MKTKILVIGRHAEILETVLRVLNKNQDWEGIGASTDEEAITLFHQQAFDIVLLGGGIDEESEQKLRTLFTEHKPDISIIQHYGGGSGLLFGEILEALSKSGK